MKDIKQEPISVQGVNVHINNVTLENEELAEYLLENGTTEEIFNGIVHAGVTHMNLLKGSIEKNLMKEQVKIIEKNMAKTIDDAVNDMNSETAKYLGNDKKKKGIFIEGVETLQKNLIAELTGAVTDEKNTDSAIYKINQTVTDFTKSFEELLEQHIEDQNESISDNFDLGDKNSIGSKLVGNVVDKLKPEIELIKKALNVQDALEETTKSGFSHEDSVQDALVSCEILGLNFDTVFENTNTSYNPDEKGRSSGRSGADVERILAFHKIGRKDPVEYVEEWEKILEFALSQESGGA